MKENLSNPNCPIWKAMELIGSKWAMLIIFLLRNGALRYGELKHLIPLISEKMLTTELKHLCDKQLLYKEQYPEIPPRTEYFLTDLGKEVLPIIEAIEVFGKKLD
ncbi:winged helix-turn-helix transcriptional regulator [Capnocytophaga haemolytica]|jgi:transcriptional regulator